MGDYVDPEHRKSEKREVEFDVGLGVIIVVLTLVYGAYEIVKLVT